MLQQTFVCLLFLGALIYLGYRFFFLSKKESCGKGCDGNCGTAGGKR